MEEGILPATETHSSRSLRQGILLVLRLVLGGIFIKSSLSKLEDPNTFIEVVTSYGLLPDTLAELQGYVLPWRKEEPAIIESTWRSNCASKYPYTWRTGMAKGTTDRR